MTQPSTVRYRRRLAALALVLGAAGIPVLGVALLPSAAASSAPSWTVYATASGSSTITPISGAGTASPTVGTSISAGQEVTNAAITPDGSELFAANSAANSNQGTVQVFSTANDSLLETLSGNGLNKPHGMAITPGGSELWVANQGANNVLVFCIAAGGCGSTAQWGLMGTIATGSMTIDVSVSPNGAFAYAANFGTNTVSVISTTSLTVSATLTVAQSPHYTTFTPDGDIGLVVSCGSTQCNSTGSVAVIQSPGSSPSVAKTLSTGQNGSHSIELLPDCTPASCVAYVANYGSGNVSTITNADSTSPTVSSSQIGSGVMVNPRFMVATPDSQYLYVGDAVTNDVYQISTASNTIVNTLSSPTMNIRRGAGPHPDLVGATGVQGFTVTPDQAPVASLSVTPGAAGQATSFDASASTVAYGSIATYVWKFGDGTPPVSTSAPTTTHTYASGGNYTATVTETSSGGASVTGAFTGHQNLATGAATAAASKSVTVTTGTSSTTSSSSTSSTSSSTSSSTTSTTQAPRRAGYWMLDSSGNVYSFGSAPTLGGATGVGTAVGIAPTPDQNGYWIAYSNGQVRAFGDAPSVQPASQAQAPVVSIASDHDGQGYWLATTAGQIIDGGDAKSFGDLSATHLNAAIVDMAANPLGGGYWMLGSDGGVFTFGSAGFFGSTGSVHLNEPAVALTPTNDANGYWFVASDGGVFTFGDAGFFGSMGGKTLNQPVNGLVVTGDGQGYWMVAADGGVFTFGDAGFVGSLGGQPIPAPIVGFAPCSGGPTG